MIAKFWSSSVWFTILSKILTLSSSTMLYSINSLNLVSFYIALYPCLDFILNSIFSAGMLNPALSCLLTNSLIYATLASSEVLTLKFSRTLTPFLKCPSWFISYFIRNSTWIWEKMPSFWLLLLVENELSYWGRGWTLTLLPNCFFLVWNLLWVVALCPCFSYFFSSWSIYTAIC